MIAPRSLPAIRAAIYARYSTALQRDASIEDQVRICRARADREGWSITEVFADHAISGASSQRPSYRALMANLRSGGIDMVLAESLDRLSRDQEHIAGFFRQASFAGVRIVTLAEGEVSELHIGLKGTMGALYLKDLADKTRRGLEGRVRQGRSGGGLCYGYSVVRGPVGRSGEAERGLRAIDPAQAAVVRRIFCEFAAGTGPKAIAVALNREGLPGPRGGIWSAGTIRGQAGRDTGILRNRLYVGQLVWNQRRWVKDPSTSRRIARTNSAAAVITEDLPELRIVEPGIWEQVQARLATQRAKVEAGNGDGVPRRRFWEQRRPQHLLTGKVVCGTCGASFAAAGKDYLTCRVAVAQGPCSNRTSVRRSKLESDVLAALSTRLMAPELVAEFVAEFTAQWNRLAAEAGAGAAAARHELEAVRRKLAGLVEAIADGLRAPGLQGRLDELGHRQSSLETTLALAQAAPAVPRLHPNLAVIYRERVAALCASFSAGDGVEVLEAVRALVERVEVHPPAEPRGLPRIELVGALGAMLRTAGVAGLGQAKGPTPGGIGPDLLACSVKVDAGIGFEPMTFRL